MVTWSVWLVICAYDSSPRSMSPERVNQAAGQFAAERAGLCEICQSPDQVRFELLARPAP